MFIFHHGDLPTAIEAAVSLVAIVLAAAAYTVATWKHSALAVQKEVTETYRQCADAERVKAMELDSRVHRLEARVRHLEIERERCAKKEAAAHAEIEQFERIVRLLTAARATLSPATRSSIEHLLAKINRAREDFAADLFAWEQSRNFYQSTALSAT